jgi:hypothetical protein
MGRRREKTKLNIKETLVFRATDHRLEGDHIQPKTQKTYVDEQQLKIVPTCCAPVPAHTPNSPYILLTSLLLLPPPSHPMPNNKKNLGSKRCQHAPTQNLKITRTMPDCELI